MVGDVGGESAEETRAGKAASHHECGGKEAAAGLRSGSLFHVLPPLEKYEATQTMSLLHSLS
jgi:hypothetical protein